MSNLPLDLLQKKPLRQPIAKSSATARDNASQRNNPLSPAFAAPLSTATIQRAQQAPGTLSGREVITLQRSMGNRAVSSLIRGQAGNVPTVQAKLKVGPAHDQYEAEADRVASNVMGSPSPASQEKAGTEKNNGKSIQRVAMTEGGKVTQDIESSIQNARGGNKSLDTGVRRKMEAGFGADFGNVRIHTDANADKLSRSLDAKAFTVGHDLFFRQGEYSPGSQDGQKLMAHELTHVVQQTGGNTSVQRKSTKGAPKIQAAGVSIQRIMTGKTFKKKTSLFGRKGKSHAFFSEIKNDIRRYHTMVNNQQGDDGTKLDLLEAILAKVNDWLNGPQAEDSSRSKYIVRLKGEVEQEIAQISGGLQDVQNTDFTDESVSHAQDDAVGDSMNRLDEVHYNYGLRERDGRAQKVQGGTFKTYFKADVDEDQFNDRHRGSERGAGIPGLNPEFGNRNIAMYKLDRLLNANVIPPTFRAMHNNKRGVAMKKVEGQTGRQLSRNGDDEMLENPIVRRGLSNLYLLDFIVAQVDRHSGNYIVEMKDGHIVGIQGIDNDIAFGKDFDMERAIASKRFISDLHATAGKVPPELTEIDHAFATRIIQVSQTPELIRNALAGLLSEEEINATIHRLTTMAGFLGDVMNQPDGPVKVHWD